MFLLICFRNGKTIAEKVLKYYEDKLTQRDMLINKLLMKNQAYKLAVRKVEDQLKNKLKAGNSNSMFSIVY
jgi:hypothetical protein